MQCDISAQKFSSVFMGGFWQDWYSASPRDIQISDLLKQVKTISQLKGRKLGFGQQFSFLGMSRGDKILGKHLNCALCHPRTCVKDYL
jgi:hypothetical protein